MPFFVCSSYRHTTVGGDVITHTVTALRTATALFIASNMYLSELLVGETCGGGHNAK